jgi:hypothetical protein
MTSPIVVLLKPELAFYARPPDIAVANVGETPPCRKGRGPRSRSPATPVTRRSVHGIVLDRAIEDPISVLGHSLGS